MIFHFRLRVLALYGQTLVGFWGIDFIFTTRLTACLFSKMLGLSPSRPNKKETDNDGQFEKQTMGIYGEIYSDPS